MSSFSTVIAEHYIDIPFNLKTSVSFKQMSSQSGAFESAVVFISWGSSGNYSVTLPYAGSGYTNGVATFKFSGELFGGSTPTNDATVRVTNTAGVLSSPSIAGTIPGVAGSRTLNLEYSTQYIMRDASDVTRSLKERIMYNEKRSGSPINANKAGIVGNAETLWQPQGNQFRLSYLMGKLKCGGCSGGAFNLNGPLQAS
jgi:hypothetical protein